MRATGATGGFAIIATGLALWTQFENTELYDRLVDKQAAKETAVEIANETCDEATSQLARLITTCTEWCEGG